MVRVSLKKSRGQRRCFKVALFVFLLAAAGVGLYRLPPSLLDSSRFFRLAADKIAGPSADVMSAEPVLRGTVYDQTFRELAVSYLLYSVNVRPRELSGREDVIQALAEATGLESGVVEAHLRQRKNVIKIADNLELKEVAALRDHKYNGVYVQPFEARFYPEHESTAGIVGYTSDSIGLAGAEGAFDMFLQHGEFKGTSLPEIDFAGEQVLGREAVDIVLTIDLTLQQEVEQQLKMYLEREQSSRALAILLDSKTGAILARAESPSFNPNYYWQASGAAQNSFLHETVAPELYREIEVRAAALRKDGEAGSPLLPKTVAAPEYGLQEYEMRWFARLADRTGQDFGSSVAGGNVTVGQQVGETDGMNAMQLAQAIASLVNGGWLITPYVLASVYDHNLQRLFFRSGENTVTNRRRVVSPAMGIRLKRELFTTETAPHDDLFFHVGSTVRMMTNGSAGRYVMQKLFLGGIPAQAPAMILVIVSQRDDLYPVQDAQVSSTDTDLMAELGRKMLPLLMQQAQDRKTAVIPFEKNSLNYNQFLIGRRVDIHDRERAQVAMDVVMPELKGLSLRKGLQRLNSYNLMVRIEGSGRIVSQSPSPGETLRGADECVLKLEPNT